MQRKTEDLSDIHSHYLKRTSQSEPNATSALHVTETEIDTTTFELYQNRVS